MDTKTHEFLCYSYKKEVASLLDDPYGVCSSKDELLEYYEDLQIIGRDCDLDFWQVAKEEGNEIEINRLRDLLNK